MNKIEDHWIAQQSYPMWEELPTDITFNHVLPFLDPSDLSTSSVACKKWHQYLTNDRVWQPLSLCHFPSLTPGFFKSFKEYQLFYSNLLKGVCSVKTLQGHTDTVYALALEGTTLVSGSEDATIKLWDLDTNTCTDTLDEHFSWICSLALKGTTLVSGSTDRTIKIWDLGDPMNACIATLQGHDGTVTSLALKDDTTLISGSEDEMIKIWDLETNTCTATLKGHKRTVYSLILEGATLISGSYDKKIKIWNLKDYTCAATFKSYLNEDSPFFEGGRSGGVNSLLLKDTTLFSGCDDEVIRVWDLGSKTCIATLREHRDAVNSLALSDPVLFSGASDNTIKVWDLRTYKCTATLPGHTSRVNALVLSGTKLFSGSSDSTIKIWDFAASHVEIFREIASAWESGDPEEEAFAHERFSKMPKTEKNKIESELSEIVKSHSLHGRSLQSTTNAQMAVAIKNYLEKLAK
jgi:WD40 repeat protein